jgi:hypothetical protein
MTGRQTRRAAKRRVTDVQRQLIEYLLDTYYEFLPDEVNRVLLEQLGSSLREQKNKIAQGRAVLLRWKIHQAKTHLMQKAGKERGGYYQKAVEEVAKAHGMGDKAVQEHIRRHPVSDKEWDEFFETALKHDGYIVIRPGSRVVIQFESFPEAVAWIGA